MELLFVYFDFDIVFVVFFLFFFFLYFNQSFDSNEFSGFEAEEADDKVPPLANKRARSASVEEEIQYLTSELKKTRLELDEALKKNIFLQTSK